MNSIIRVLQKTEVHNIGQLTDPLLHGGESFYTVREELNEYDLNRELADIEQCEEIAKLQMESVDYAAVVPVIARMREEQRTRRDARITAQNHKRLLFGCLETAFRHKLTLENALAQQKNKGGGNG